MTEIGQLLKSRYLISSLLSGGGFSVTYLAKDTHLPDYPDCVVKQLRLLSTDPQQVEKVREFFFNEAKMLRKLGAIHSQIPELLAYFTDEDSENFYIVQELVPGKTLKQLLGTELKLTEPEVIYIMKETLEVLEFIHSYNVIHLDIKPDNLILRARDYKIALIDFGSVKQVRTQIATSNSLTPQTTTLGTPGYMPCEQSFGRPKLSSDFYALGMVAIRALTGIHPKELEEDLTTGEVLWKERAFIGAELKALLDKMVRYHFKQRPQSAADILVELAKIATLYPEDVTRCSDRLRAMIGDRELPQASPASQEPTQPSDASRARIDLPTIVSAEPVSLNSSPNLPLSPSRPSKPDTHLNSISPQSTPTPMPPGLVSSNPTLAKTESTNRPGVSDAQSIPASRNTPAQPPGEGIPPHPNTVFVPPQSRVKPQNQPQLAAATTDYSNSQYSNPQFSNSSATDPRFSESQYPQSVPPRRRREQRNLQTKVAPLLVVTSAIVLGMFASWGGARYLDRRAYSSGDRQTLNQALELAATNLPEAIRLAEQIPQNSPVYSRATQLLSDLRAEQTLQEERELLSRARDLSATDLEAALATVNEIQSDSPLYDEARGDKWEWQSQLLEMHLASSSQTLATLSPLVDIRSDALFLQYDASSDAKLVGDEGIRRVAIATMSILRSRYTEFERLIVYPEGGELQGMLELSVWSSYEAGNIGLDRLLPQISVEERLTSTPHQVATSPAT